MQFEWNRSEVIALAKESCVQCHGYGLRERNSGQAALCHCVLRKVFRVCYQRFRQGITGERGISPVRLEAVRGKDRRHTWGMKNEEYLADFCLIAERTLSPIEHQIFRFHFLLGADWRLCCRRLQMDRGIFFHHVYRLEHKLGRAFRETQPYPLFPLDDYFTRSSDEPVQSCLAVVERNPRLKPPLKKAA